jgi:hypothetical protein
MWSAGTCHRDIGRPREPKDVDTAAQYARIKPLRGHKKALGVVNALDHLRVLAHAHNRRAVNDLGGDYFQRHDPERQTKRLIRPLEALGHTVTPTTTAEAVAAS